MLASKLLTSFFDFPLESRCPKTIVQNQLQHLGNMARSGRKRKSEIDASVPPGSSKRQKAMDANASSGRKRKREPDAAAASGSSGRGRKRETRAAQDFAELNNMDKDWYDDEDVDAAPGRGIDVMAVDLTQTFDADFTESELGPPRNLRANHWVCMFDLKVQLDLMSLAFAMKNTTYNHDESVPQRKRGPVKRMTYEMTKHHALFEMYPSGKVKLWRGRSYKHAVTAARRFVLTMRHVLGGTYAHAQGVDFRVLYFNGGNLRTQFYTVSLVKLVDELKEACKAMRRVAGWKLRPYLDDPIWEPEKQSWLRQYVYFPTGVQGVERKVTVDCFTSGAVNLLGARTKAEFFEAYEIVFRYVLACRKEGARLNSQAPRVVSKLLDGGPKRQRRTKNGTA